MNPGVYLYWTCRSTVDLDTDLFRPEEPACLDTPAAMFGQPDTDNLLRVPLLGNRVDRFRCDRLGACLRVEREEAARVPERRRADPPGQGDLPAAAWKPRRRPDCVRADGKLYVATGDLGRRGQMQNLTMGPTRRRRTTSSAARHRRSAPERRHPAAERQRHDACGQPVPHSGSAVGDVFAYGLRNTFGIAFDPVSERCDQQNADDAFDEMNS